jgi:hypothetical protein
MIGLNGFSQCVMCRTAAESSSKTQGLNTGILYLMATPYVVMLVAFGIWYWRKRQKGRRSEGLSK